MLFVSINTRMQEALGLIPFSIKATSVLCQVSEKIWQIDTKQQLQNPLLSLSAMF